MARCADLRALSGGGEVNPGLTRSDMKRADPRGFLSQARVSPGIRELTKRDPETCERIGVCSE